MIGPTPFRDMLLVAWFELKEMLRTRRALVVIALYLLGGLVASRVFVGVIGRLEDVAADMLQTTRTATPGALTRQVLHSDAYREALVRLFPNRNVADFLLGLPPIVLFFAWSSLAFVPFLIMMTAADTVTQEVQDRGIRFVVIRTGRVEFVLGKYLGQALLMSFVVLLTGFVYLAVAWRGLQGFEFWPTLDGILIFWPRIVVYGFAFVGLAGLCAMNARSAAVARALSFVGLTVSWVLGEMAYRWSDGIFGAAWTAIGFLVPFSHKAALWRPGVAGVLPECAVLVALGLVYLSVGLVMFRRKDL